MAEERRTIRRLDYLNRQRNEWIHPQFDQQTSITMDLIKYVINPDNTDVIVKTVPHLEPIIKVLNHFKVTQDSSTTTRTISDFTQKTKLLDDAYWTNTFAKLIAGDSQEFKSYIIGIIKRGDRWWGGEKAAGGFWLNKLIDECKSELATKITEEEGVHCQDIAVFDEKMSPAFALQQGLAQLSLEMLGNISMHAGEEYDFSQSTAEGRIPRKSAPAERRALMKEADKLLDKMKEQSSPRFAACNGLEGIKEKLGIDSPEKIVRVRILRSDGIYKLISLSTNTRKEDIIGLFEADDPKTSESDHPSMWHKAEYPEDLDPSIPTLRHFDVLGYSHITEPLTVDKHTHDMSIWFEKKKVWKGLKKESIGVIKDRKLDFKDGKMGFKVRLLNENGTYYDTTVDKVLRMDSEKLQRTLEDVQGKSSDIIDKTVAEEPPMFVLSLSHGNKNSPIYKQRADNGRAFAHLVFNTQNRTIEIMHSHGPVDGDEAKRMALAVGYAVGTREEKVSDDFFVYPSQKKEATGLDLKMINLLTRIKSYQPLNRDQNQEMINELGIEDVVSFRTIDFSGKKHGIKSKLDIINEAFQKPTSDLLKRALKQIGITNPDQLKIIINILTPPLGISNILSFASEEMFGKTAVCVQPIRKPHRLSLALVPDMKLLLKELIKKENFSPAVFQKHMKDFQDKLLAAALQTNLFSKLSIGHLQTLYLATQGWRGLASYGTKVFQEKVEAATRVHAQVSAIGKTSEISDKAEGNGFGYWTEGPNPTFYPYVNPRTGKPPTIRSFITALSGEPYLSTSIGLVGESLSFRNKMTPELFDSLDFDWRHFSPRNIQKTFIKGDSGMTWDDFYSGMTGISEFMKKIYPEEVIEGKVWPGLNNTKLLKEVLAISRDMEKDKKILRIMTTIALQDKLDKYVENLNVIAHNMAGVLSSKGGNITESIANMLVTLH